MMNESIMMLLAFNTFVVLGVGVLVMRYVIDTERRLVIIESKLGLT